MSEDTIYLRDSRGGFQRVSRAAFDAEDILQALVEEYPELLSGEQINPDRPVRWMLVDREAGIPGGEGESDRWSVDHLLLDQDGVPTFVEIKRSTDTRIRREVVGQMLDYAANAPKYWPEDRIRSLATEQFADRGGVDVEVGRLLDQAPTSDAVEGFWDEVGENLRIGRLRLLFVADEIPRELRRVIEFLNTHLDTIEVLGMEIRQYASGEVQALVPRVVGQTEAARDGKSRASKGSRRQLTEDEFLERISPENRGVVEHIFEEARDMGLIVAFRSRGVSIRVPDDEGPITVFYIWHQGANDRPYDFVWGYTQYLPEGIREAAESRLSRVSGVTAKGNYTFEAKINTDDQVVQELWTATKEVVGLIQRELASSLTDS